MKKQSILLLILLITLNSKAKLSEVVLSDVQIQSILKLTNTINSKDTNAYRLSWKNSKILSEIPLNDFIAIVQIKIPSNKSIYNDSLHIYKLCGVIAKELTNKIINDIKSESADEKISIANSLKFEKGEYFQNNLNIYLQNQIFDFYFNNNVISYLKNDEYVKLLKPKAIYKLLSDTKSPENLYNEILFIANNSKYIIL